MNTEKQLANIINAKFADIDYRIEAFTITLKFLINALLTNEQCIELFKEVEHLDKERKADKNITKAREFIKNSGKVENAMTDPIKDVLNLFMSTLETEGKESV